MDRVWFPPSFLGAKARHAVVHHVGNGDYRIVDDPHLFGWLYAPRSERPAVHVLPKLIQLLHADAGDFQQSGADVFWLGRGRSVLLPADRLLVR